MVHTICNTIQGNVMLWVFESLWNNSSGSNHVLNMLGEHDNLDQYGPCAKQSERMLCPHSTSSVGIKNVHLCTLASKFSSLTDSTQGFWLVTYFPSYLWTILYMNKLYRFYLAANAVKNDHKSFTKISQKHPKYHIIQIHIKYRT